MREDPSRVDNSEVEAEHKKLELELLIRYISLDFPTKPKKDMFQGDIWDLY